ncbi:hypothetical protein DC31_05925 [Microbacterium sp. CH12i]|uniref:hypothetical protein n=1 Tax=Microbacterium sp. CH12i TaxID=1479651 RepID=UPI000460B45E|nr:hypothetical protein [Microbacterium sp. CH12i]KDA04628.1 hypothetical protein DC31_05925 [Microbacterium sp. CH12i]
MGSKLDEAISDLTAVIESGELPREVTASAAHLDAIRFVVQQWYAITDNAGLDLSASAEAVARELFVRGATGEEFVWGMGL